jgi:Holliday junction resolvasome RuvABC endonuclease subunit
MKFISIDSSLANTGVAIGVIENNYVNILSIELHSTEKAKAKTIRASSDTITRCKSNYLFLKTIIAHEKPDVIFVETPSGSQNASGMKSYGATCQLLATLTPAPIEVTPIEVKVRSIGKKTASKKEMIDWAYNLYPSLNWSYHAGKLQQANEHMADAIATAYAGIKSNDFERIKNLIKT